MNIAISINARRDLAEACETREVKLARAFASKLSLADYV